VFLRFAFSTAAVATTEEATTAIAACYQTTEPTKQLEYTNI